MKNNRMQVAEKHEKILDIASGLFRKVGFDGIGISKLMQKVELTHGTFYAHFSSRDDLVAQACTRAAEQILDDGKSRALSEDPYAAFVKNYLSLQHRDNPDRGCLMAALGPEVPRQSDQVRGAFAAATKRLLSALMSVIDETRGKKKEELPNKEEETQAISNSRQQALITLASLVGAQVIARAVKDDALSEEILQTLANHLLERSQQHQDTFN